METRVSPLPVGQVIALAGVNFVNAVVYLVTLPVAPFIVISFCPDLAANDVGFRSGALEGCFHAGAFFGAAFWAWVADRHGRKSALLWSLAGTAILSVAFGLASSYGAALVIKLLWGFISGNIGVAKTALSEISDDSTGPRAFSYISVATGLGRLVGPAIGGLLAQPALKYANVFPADGLFGRHPFLLPCLLCAIITAAVWALGASQLRETRPLSLQPAPGAIEQARTAVVQSVPSATVADVGQCAGLAAADTPHHAAHGAPFREEQRKDGMRLLVDDGAAAADRGGDFAVLMVEQDGRLTGNPLRDAGPSHSAAAAAAAATPTRNGSTSSSSHYPASAASGTAVSSTAHAAVGTLEGSGHSEAAAAAGDSCLRGCEHSVGGSIGAGTCGSNLTARETPPVAAAVPGHVPSAGSAADAGYWNTLNRLLRDRAVASTVAIFACMSAVGLVATELFPLYVVGGRDVGGFSWTGEEVGLVVALTGPVLLAWTLFAYDRLVKRMGLVQVARWSIGLNALCMAITPLCSLTLRARPPLTAEQQHAEADAAAAAAAAASAGDGAAAAAAASVAAAAVTKTALEWVALAVVFVASTLTRTTAYTCIFVFVSNSALPLDRATANGIGQAASSLARALGPPLGTSLFAWSVSPGNTAAGWPLDFHLSWYVLAACTAGVLWLSYSMPPWIARKRESSTSGAIVK